MQPKILFVTHSPRQCGVYEFGKNLFEAISHSSKFQFVKAVCESLADLKNAIKEETPDAIIYNYHPYVMPWLCTKVVASILKNNIAGIKLPQVGIIHEVTQQVADTATADRSKFLIGESKKLNSLFDFYIAADPTLILNNSLVFKTGRLILEYHSTVPKPSITTIGSYGFASANKGFEQLVEKVQNEFDEATIRLNMPFAFYGDKSGDTARRIAEACRKIITKPGIRLDISHDFLDDPSLMDFLAGNSLNLFMYRDKEGRGISSATDFALAIRKPIGVSRCPMFRHLLNTQPSICVEDVSLKSIISNGFTPLEDLSMQWSKQNIIVEYEQILQTVFSK